MLNWHYYWGQ